MLDFKPRRPATRTSTYRGTCEVDGRRGGVGRETWKNREQEYEGMFAKDAFHGEGSCKMASGRAVHEGSFYANVKEGYGVTSLADGSCFEGLFRDNRPFGPGVYTYADGRQDVGFWFGGRIVRLSRSVDRVIPRLTSSPAGKLKLLPFQRLIPFEESDCLLTALMQKHGLDPCQYRRLCSDFVRDRRSLFFDRVAFDGALFVRIGKPSATGAAAAKKVTDELVAECARHGRSACSLEERTEGETSSTGILRYHWRNNTLDGFPVTLPGQATAETIHEEARPTEDANVAEAADTIHLMSWNSSEMCTDMLRHIFRYRSFEDSLTFKVSDLMAGVRARPRRTGSGEKACLHFLRTCSDGRVQDVRRLLRVGRISEALTDARGNNGIMFAAAADRHDIIDLLVKCGADVNSVNDEKLTPLNLCILRKIAEANCLGNWEVSFLPPLDGSACPEVGDAESGESLDTATALNEGTDQTGCAYPPAEGEEDSREMPHPSLCAPFRRDEYLKSVAPASQNDTYLFDVAPDDEEDSETAEASGTGNEVLRQSLPREETEEDAPEGSDFDGGDARLREKLENIDRTIQLLLMRGANPNAGDVPKPCLHLAVHSKDVGLLRVLLRHGASPDAQSLPQEGLLTPLHVVVLMKPSRVQVDMCRILLSHGASTEKEASPGFYARGEERVVSDPGHGLTPLQLLCTRKSAQTVDPNGFLGEVAVLLALASRPNHFFGGHSALTLSMVCGNYSVMESLLKCERTDPNKILGRYLGTSLHVLVSAELQKRTAFEDSLRMCELLLGYGADPDLKTNTSPTLRETCVDYGHREIEKEWFQLGQRKLREEEKLLGAKDTYRAQNHIRIVEYLSGRSGRRKRQAFGDGETESAATGRSHSRTCEKATEMSPRGAASAAPRNGEGKARGKRGSRRPRGRRAGVKEKKAPGGKDSGEATKTKKTARTGKEKPARRGVDARPGGKPRGQQAKRSSPNKAPEETPGPKGVDKRLPVRLHQSFLRLFGLLAENVDPDEFLMPYVVLRNGDLYYRFKGKKFLRTEQYSLI